MKVILGSDHGGFELKSHLKIFLEEQSCEVEDVGCDDETSCDYPEYGKAVAKKCVEEGVLGIVICGTGIGISIAANKVKKARVALCTNETMARLAREHNNAQVLALGGRIIGKTLAENIVHAFLHTDFSEEKRHERRILSIES